MPSSPPSSSPCPVPARPSNVTSLFDDDDSRRFVLDDLDGARIAVVVQPTGDRDLEILTDEDDEPAAVLSFTRAQARALAGLLEQSD